MQKTQKPIYHIQFQDSEQIENLRGCCLELSQTSLFRCNTPTQYQFGSLSFMTSSLSHSRMLLLANKVCQLFINQRTCNTNKIQFTVLKFYVLFESTDLNYTYIVLIVIFKQYKKKHSTKAFIAASDNCAISCRIIIYIIQALMYSCFPNENVIF